MDKQPTLYIIINRETKEIVNSTHYANQVARLVKEYSETTKQLHVVASVTGADLLNHHLRWLIPTEWHLLNNS